MTLRFADRDDAGRRLGQALVEMKLTNPVVLALPRGGVPVAMEVARARRSARFAAGAQDRSARSA